MKNYCDISNKPFDYYMDFGLMPIANNYSLRKNRNFKYDCIIGISYKNKYFKNINTPDQKKLFTSDYPYNASLSEKFKKYLNILANEIYVKNQFKKSDKLIIEIGSCDGTFLEFFSKKGIRHLGIEPTLNNHKIAQKKGVTSINKFFNAKLSKEIRKKYSEADVIFASNVIAHINNINDTFRGIKNCLKKDGIFIFENIYLLDLINNFNFDQLYDEHVYTLSVTTVDKIARKHDLKLYDVKHTSIQGGSMRYYITANSNVKKSINVKKFLDSEKKSNFFNKAFLTRFFKKCEGIRDELLSISNDLKIKNKKVVGYGASAKATFLINFCNLNSRHIKYIFDSSPLKKDKFVPGTNIKIIDEKNIKNYKFDHVILFSWNHKTEIKKKNSEIVKKNNAKWIIPFTESKISRKGDKFFDDVYFIKDETYYDKRGALNIVIDNSKNNNFSVKQVLLSNNKKKGTIRGLHYQSPYKQAKIIKVLKGKIFDVFINIDPTSKDYGNYGHAYIDASKGKNLYISNKYAHGFQTLTDDTTVLYFTDNMYSEKSSKTIDYNDETLGIKWPMKVTAISSKDKKGFSFKK